MRYRPGLTPSKINLAETARLNWLEQSEMGPQRLLRLHDGPVPDNYLERNSVIERIYREAGVQAVKEMGEVFINPHPTQARFVDRATMDLDGWMKLTEKIAQRMIKERPAQPHWRYSSGRCNRAGETRKSALSLVKATGVC
jgi:hypothetical protein